MPSQFLQDLQADIASGRVRAIEGDAWDQAYWSRCAEKRAQFEREAEAIAKLHHFDVRTLWNLMFVSMNAFHGSKAFDEFPLFRRALAIARERQARAA